MFNFVPLLSLLCLIVPPNAEGQIGIGFGNLEPTHYKQVEESFMEVCNSDGVTGVTWQAERRTLIGPNISRHSEMQKRID